MDDVGLLDTLAVSGEERELLRKVLNSIPNKKIRVTNTPNGNTLITLTSKLTPSNYIKVLNKLRNLLPHTPPRDGVEHLIYKGETCILGVIEGFKVTINIVTKEVE